MKAAFIDLDGVIVNNNRRMLHASRAFADYMQQHIAESDPAVAKELVKEAEDLYWETAFTPKLVDLDTLIDGAREAIKKLADEEYFLFYLTSRPESMRKATVTWLLSHKILHTIYAGRTRDIELVMKVPAFRFTKTITWKTGMVDTLSQLYSIDEVLFVDDQEETRAEVFKHLSHTYPLKLYASLQDAIMQSVIHVSEEVS